MVVYLNGKKRAQDAPFWQLQGAQADEHYTEAKYQSRRTALRH